MSVTIAKFSPDQAEEYISNYEYPIISGFVKLLYLRDIQKVSITDSDFLEKQEKLLPHLKNALGPWIEKNRQRTFISFQEVISFFGYLGLNGTNIPQLVNAVNHPFLNYKRDDGAFLASSGKINKCANMRFLRAVLALGFAQEDFVKQACEAGL